MRKKNNPFILFFLSALIAIASEANTQSCENIFNQHIAAKIAATFNQIYRNELPSEAQEILKRNRRLALEIVQNGGRLDEYLLRQGVDLASVQVYLFGSSVSGISENPFKNGSLIEDSSDIDLMVVANKINGEPWRMPAGPNVAFTYQGIDVEVISKYTLRSIDNFLFATFGEVLYHNQDWSIPPSAILLRSPVKMF